MPFLPNLDTLQTISRRVQEDSRRVATAKQTLQDVLNDLNAIPTDFQSQLSQIDSDVAADMAHGDAAAQQLAGITAVAKQSGENDRLAVVAKVTAAIAAL